MTTEIVPSKTLVQMRSEGLATVSPLNQDVQSLTITDDESYVAADRLLCRVIQAEAGWAAKIDKILGPIAQGLELLKGLRDDIAGPLKASRLAIKEKMKEYKLLEAKRLRDEAEAKEAEKRRLAKVAADAAKAEENAKTFQMKQKLALKRAEAEQQRAEIEAAPEAKPVQIKGGGAARTIIKWRVTDKAKFLAYVLENYTELEALVLIDDGQMTAKRRLDKAQAGPWMPGVEVYEDISIAGRG